MGYGNFEKKEFEMKVFEREIVSVSSSSELGWKPIRERGTPREPAPNFFKSPGKWFKHELWSWRFYTWVYAAAAFAVLLINAFVLIAIAVQHPFDVNGRSTVFEGSCTQAIKSNRYAHWFFSVFGTGYLSASAYVMYCLTGPTRKEIDKAHSQGKWLDIGVLSMKNVFAVSRKRAIYFLLLGISSPFIQFFYNSVLFITYSTNAYSAFVAHETFLNPGNISIQLSMNQAEAQILDSHYSELAIHLHEKNQRGELERLSPEACIDAYAIPLQSRRRNVVLISDDVRRTADVFDVFHAFVPTEHPDAGGEQYSWICDDKLAQGDQCLYHINNVRSNPKNWTVSDDAHVHYCLSESTPEHCKLSVSLNMSLICLFTILFKVLVMFAVAIHVQDQPLMTTGDAIESFMKNPDPYTQGMCMATKRMVDSNTSSWPRNPMFVSIQKFRWAHGIKTRIAFFCLFFTLSLCLNAALFCTVKEPISIPNFLQIGLGQVNRNFFIGWHHKAPRFFARTIFLTNVGHAIFGVSYILYNNVFYTMSFSAEWARYAIHKKGLRVSEAPRGAQRTVYFFLMPYKLAIPIMLLGMGIHTLISNTLFLVDVETYGHDPTLNQGVGTYIRTPQYDFTTTGFSPLGNALLIIAGVAMMGYLLGCASAEYKSAMPVTSTCSVAISACCHPDEDEPDDFYLQKISWGVTSIKDGIGHCTFSSKPTQLIDENTPYA